eukprot:2326473-Prymnesium_polylepis.1
MILWVPRERVETCRALQGYAYGSVWGPGNAGQTPGRTPPSRRGGLSPRLTCYKPYNTAVLYSCRAGRRLPGHAPVPRAPPA